ncbi:hypothetical protein [Streptomyces sp. NPDC102462]|uniref:VMAP-C domain-containing protein n=1 Tax=Streptomyces sp. NPDC102462 TaxID=3366178 RepID=UPI00380CC6B2
MTEEPDGTHERARDTDGDTLPAIQRRIRGEVVDALQSVRSMPYDSFRALLQDELADEIGRPFALGDLPDWRMWCRALTRACTRDGEACLLPGLARVVQDLDQNGPPAPALHRAADEWTAASALGRFVPHWTWLRLELNGRPDDDLGELLRAATDGRMTRPPDHCTSVWDLFLYLVGQAARPGGVPPWTVLLDRVARERGPRTRRDLPKLTRHSVLDLGGPELADRLDKDRWARRAPAVLPRSAVDYLLIGIAPDPLTTDWYTVSYWLQSPDEHGRLVTTPGRAVRRVRLTAAALLAPGPAGARDERAAALREEQLAALEEAVNEIVSLVEVEEGARGRGADLRLEFVLPLELLNLPVHWWSAGRGGARAKLAARYEVVLRSLDRLRNQGWYREWIRRWQRLQSGSDCRPVFMTAESFPSDARDVSGLVAQLNDERYVAVMLSEPPDPWRQRGPHEAAAALSSGLPVLVWHRTEETNVEIKQSVNQLLRGRLPDLPARVAAARRQVLVEPPEAHPVTEHLAVLWDDPGRNPLAPGEPVAPGAL